MTIEQTSFDHDHKKLEQRWRSLFDEQGVTAAAVQRFQQVIYHYYHTHKRSFAWRENINEYRVVISEVMLQQTQTDRVIQKFHQFISLFPDFTTLAQAPFEHVLRVWKGLGYNRRALALQKIAQQLVTEYEGKVPPDPAVLVKLPGIGKATAASICAFAFNYPTAFIETNIRTVFIYFFFRGQEQVEDDALMKLVRAAVDEQQPREWYYALMDYGVMLKKREGNLSRLSSHYRKQSRFEGSDRQIRGIILQALLDYPGIGEEELFMHIGKQQSRVAAALESLCSEGFISKSSHGRLWLSR